MDHDRAEHVRKNATAACMFAAPILFIVADSIYPITHTDAGDILADVRGSTGRLYGSTVLTLLAMVALAGAVIGLAHLLHERRPGLALLGGGITLAGIVGASAGVALQLAVFEMAQSGRNAVAMQQLLDDLIGSAAPVLFTGELLSVGIIVLAVALTMARTVPNWAAAALAIGAIGEGIGVPLSAKPVILVADVLLLVGLGAIGWEVVGETDDEWAHTPEFHGFGQPALG